MTRIESFTVAGLAGRAKPYSLELDPAANVFFGVNGSGKTTLLRLLYSAVKNRSGILTGSPVTEARVAFYSHDRDQHYVRTLEHSSGPPEEEDAAEYVYDTDGDLVLVPVRSGTTRRRCRTKPVRNQPFQATYLSTSRLASAPTPRQYRGAVGREMDESRLDRIFADQVTQLWRTYTNRTLSEVRQIQQAGLAGILQSLFVLPHAEHAPHLEANIAFSRTNDFLRRQGITKKTGTLASFRKLYESDSRLSTVVDDIDAIERRIAIAEEPRRRLEELVGSFISQK